MPDQIPPMLQIRATKMIVRRVSGGDATVLIGTLGFVANKVTERQDGDQNTEDNPAGHVVGHLDIDWDVVTFHPDDDSPALLMFGQHMCDVRCGDVAYHYIDPEYKDGFCNV